MAQTRKLVLPRDPRPTQGRNAYSQALAGAVHRQYAILARTPAGLADL